VLAEPLPFHSSALVKVIDRLTASNDLHAVLVTDRDRVTLNDLGSQLKALGMHCMEARDSVEAIALGREVRPDLIILDVTIPNQKALEELKVLRECEKSPKSRYFPLVIYSHKDLSEEERKNLKLGITNHLGQNESSQSELMDAVSLLLGELCQ
jgi:CheY-like chemotaxis protein